jgi:hypothetical protein
MRWNVVPSGWQSEMAGGVEDAMRAYLAWEIDLVNQMATDDDHRFKVAAG